uniref:Uncharacterized protein n=1 Tax=Parastrongyloides trichosuri TaxID=131310 RepID=A0A0N4ZYJ2_PARTI
MSKQIDEFISITNNNKTSNQRSSSGSGKMLSLPSMFTINKAKSSTDVRGKEFYDLNGFNESDDINKLMAKNRLSPQCSMKKNNKYLSSADVSRVGDDVIQNSNRSNGGSHGNNSPINKSNNSLSSEK